MKITCELVDNGEERHKDVLSRVVEVRCTVNLDDVNMSSPGVSLLVEALIWLLFLTSGYGWLYGWVICCNPCSIFRIFLIRVPVCLCSAVLHNKGGPSMPVMHPKRSPTSTGDRELREGRMPSRKASCSVMGSHSLPPSSPMVSSANNPNKSEIPDRRKDMTATTVNYRSPPKVGRGRWVSRGGPKGAQGFLHTGLLNWGSTVIVSLFNDMFMDLLS